MTNPKPVHTLTRWKVLSNEEASELIDTKRLQREIRNVPTENFTNKELERLSHGETLFCVWKGQYIMVAYRDGVFVCYEVEERKPEPPKSVAQKVRAFFRGMFLLMVVCLCSCYPEEHNKNIKSDSGREFAVIEVDSCEYLIGHAAYEGYFAHKGNCKYCASRQSRRN